MTKPAEKSAQPDYTPEEQAFIHRMQTARALSQDFINILSRTGVQVDIAIVVGFGVVASALSSMARQSPADAQATIQVLAADFEGLVASLGLGEGKAN